MRDRAVWHKQTRSAVPQSRLTHLVVLSWQALQDSLFAVVMLANKRSRCQNVHLQRCT